MRSGAAVAAAVLGLIGGTSISMAGPASAGTAVRKGAGAASSSATVLTFVIPGLALALVAGLVLSTVLGSADNSGPTDRSSSETEPRVSGAAPEREESASSGPSRGHRLAPKRYQLTVIDEGMVAVKLDGGPSGMYRFGEFESAPPLRMVSGYVRSPSGVAVEGAVVVADTALTSSGPSLSAKAGATTNSSGYFELVLRSDKAMELLVLHQKGWSRPFSIAAGRDDLSVKLNLLVPGTIVGRVQRAGEPVVAKVSFALAGTTLRLSIVSDAEGRFVLENLPPGTYATQIGLDQDIAGGSSRVVGREVELRSLEVERLEVDLPTGALIAVTPQVEGLADYMVEYVLTAGHGDYPAPARAFELHRNVGDKNAKSMLFGGSDKNKVMQFHDVDPGAHTVCVLVWLLPEELESFECRHLRVSNASSVVEETFRFPQKAR